MPKFIKYGVSAAHQALTDSSWFPKSEDECINTVSFLIAFSIMLLKSNRVYALVLE
jgi:hypothetical protein